MSEPSRLDIHTLAYLPSTAFTFFSLLVSYFPHIVFGLVPFLTNSSRFSALLAQILQTPTQKRTFLLYHNYIRHWQALYE